MDIFEIYKMLIAQFAIGRKKKNGQTQIGL